MNKSDNNAVSNRLKEKIEKLNINPGEKETLYDLMSSPISYIPEDRFNKKTQMEPIMEKKVEVIPNISLDAGEEEIIFLQMNYCRHKLCQVRRRLLRKKDWRVADVEPLLYWNKLQLDYRSKIVSCNMGLVLSMVQKVSYPGVEFADLISEGSMALLRAVEKFDCSRGFKFSTYACRAILKGFSRAAKQNYRYRNLFPTQLETSMEKDNKLERERQGVQENLIDEVQAIMNNNMADLSEIEKSVVEMRFSLREEQAVPMTLKQVGARLGLTKERIRQIQNKALTKLRTVAEERMLTA